MQNNKQKMLKLFVVEKRSQVKENIKKKNGFINKRPTQKFSIAPATLLV